MRRFQLPLLGSSRRPPVGVNQDSPDPEGPLQSAEFQQLATLYASSCHPMLEFAGFHAGLCCTLLTHMSEFVACISAASGHRGRRPTLRGTMISAEQAYAAAPALISREVRDAFAVVEPHVPRPVACEDLLGLADELWLRREHGDERSPSLSLLEVLLAHQSFVGQSAAD
jgi:hypothetical protein